MAKYYQISVSQLVDTFSRIESGTALDFIINTSDTLLSDLTISKGDVLIASVNDNVYYNFDVVGKSTNEIQLKKTFEIQKTINHLIQGIGILEEISENEYNSICSKLFLEFNPNPITEVNNIDLDNVKESFADWLFQKGKYLRVYKGEKSVLIEKLTEFETAYENDFGISIFDFSNNSLELVIKELETNNIESYGQIGDINRRTVGNGSVKAILGPNNYIKFLRELLRAQKTISKNNKIVTEQVVFNIVNFQNKATEAGLIFSSQLIQRFIASLCTKPFVICSGLSGSGKTKLAQAFAQWISADKLQYEIVPVGADWTNREPLLGYPNALDKEDYVCPENGVLNLLIRAKNEYDIYLADETKIPKPYFLILDEMNLSHVERYFADFLSTMESGDAIPLHKIVSVPGEEKIDIPQSLKLPKNLFIIGTVNIDETTYMFSPKVLDRANTIEFRLTTEDLEKYIASDIKLNIDLLKAQGANMSNSFIKMALQETDKNLKQSEIDLKLFFSELKKSGAEFGYRTASEIGRLMYMLKELGESGYSLLDIAIMQKLLPKLHGSRNKLTKVLPILGGFCLTDNSKIKEDYLDKFVSNSLTEVELKADTNIKYKISFEKICRMYKNAVENGFASYAEA